jgi:thiosulfate reductase cytochrome b subunit
MKGLYLHPLPVRIWHWVNAVIVLMLMVTGIQLRVPQVSLFADYGTAVALHKYLGFALGGSFFFWLAYYVATLALARQYILDLKGLKGMPAQALYYLVFFFRGHESPYKPSPERKFNPLQKVAYSFIMIICTPVVIITGIFFSDILYFSGTISRLGGLRVLDAIHVVFGYLFVIYLVVHVYMATLGKKVYSHVKAMITGYEE